MPFCCLPIPFQARCFIIRAQSSFLIGTARCSAIAQHRTVIDYPHRCNSQRQVIRDALLALLNDACVCADIMPVYHLGDSQLFNFVGFKWLSRKLRASLGVIWGRWGLPLPRQHDLIALVDYPISGTY